VNEVLIIVGMLRELFTAQGLVVMVPLAAAAGLAFVTDFRLAAWINIGAATLAFGLACALPWEPTKGPLLLVDPLAAHMAILTGFIGMTTAWFSRGYVAVEAAAGRLDAGRLREYHALFQTYLGFMLLALLSNNVPATWGSIEAATIASVLVVGLPRTAAAIEASWKQFLLCGVGISMAFFGTTLLYLAAVPALGSGLPAMSWSQLPTAAPQFHSAMLNLAFVFLLLGYGTKAGLAPLNAWMPDAHAEGPTPVSAVLSGSILNVALFVILRLRGLLDANAGAIAPGPPIMALGLASVLLAAFSLWPRRDVKRFFAFSSIEQSGVAAFAFGLGGVAATFAGLLHLTLHTLTKAAVLQCVGRATQLKGGQGFTDIGGLLVGHRALGLTLAAGIVAMAALPPFGLFASEFLVLSETVRRLPWLAVPLALGLLVGGWALAMRLISLCLGAPTADRGPAPGLPALVPAWVHLAVVLLLGLAMPGAVAAWLVAIAEAAQ
jgi:hydrogenase-4 component F